MTKVLRLGVLRAVGGKIEFTPAPHLPDLAVNEDAELEVVWHYEEVSRARETFRVQLVLEALGAKHTLQAAVDDRPIGNDDAWGTLKHPLRATAREDIVVKWDLRAAYRKGSWTSAAIDGNDFRATGDLLLHVR